MCIDPNMVHLASGRGLMRSTGVLYSVVQYCTVYSGLVNEYHRQYLTPSEEKYLEMNTFNWSEFNSNII